MVEWGPTSPCPISGLRLLSPVWFTGARSEAQACLLPAAFSSELARQPGENNTICWALILFSGRLAGKHQVKHGLASLEKRFSNRRAANGSWAISSFLLYKKVLGKIRVLPGEAVRGTTLAVMALTSPASANESRSVIKSKDLPSLISWNWVEISASSCSFISLYFSSVGFLKRTWNRRNFAAQRTCCYVWVTVAQSWIWLCVWSRSDFLEESWWNLEGDLGT